jgi:hypothetical protein
MPTEEICAAHNMFCFAALADLHPGTMYTDLTGAFPVRSFKNMQYVFVAYIYDLNAILVHAMPSKNNTAMIAAFSNIFSTLAVHGYAPTLNVMDNECSKAVESQIKANKMNVHLMPPHNHRIMWQSMPLPRSRSTSLWASPLLTKTARSNFGMNFYPESN